MPYLFSDDEIAALLAATAILAPRLRAATYRTYFGLLAATGMRGCEARRLDRDDVDLQRRLVTIRQSKFGKSRQIPIHASTVAALAAYTKVRDRCRPRPTHPSFLISTVGTRLARAGTSKAFRQLASHVGLAARPGAGPPGAHALRHTFAVATLVGWYRHDIDVTASMPLLSAYLGHTKPSSTYWYLQAVPELLGLAAGRLELAHPGGRP